MKRRNIKSISRIIRRVSIIRINGINWNRIKSRSYSRLILSMIMIILIIQPLNRWWMKWNNRLNRILMMIILNTRIIEWWWWWIDNKHSNAFDPRMNNTQLWVNPCDHHSILMIRLDWNRSLDIFSWIYNHNPTHNIRSNPIINHSNLMIRLETYCNRWTTNNALWIGMII